MSPVAEYQRKSRSLEHSQAQPRVANRAPKTNRDDHDEHDHEHGFEWFEVARVVFVALAAAAVWFHWWEPFHRVSVIGLAATLIGGYPIFKEAFDNIVERRMTMELSMTIAPFPPWQSVNSLQLWSSPHSFWRQKYWRD